MILEAVVYGGGTFSAIALTAWAVHRPERRERRECERLHKVAAMEQDIYGQVMSSDAAEHVKKCGITTVGFNNYVRAAADVYVDGRHAARPGDTLRREDVEHLRQLVAECEAIKQAITDIERLRIERPSPLILTGPDPRLVRDQEQVKELRDVLQSKRAAIEALARTWDTDPRTGPGVTRTC